MREIEWKSRLRSQDSLLAVVTARFGQVPLARGANEALRALSENERMNN
jgi:hypothetical protein